MEGRQQCCFEALKMTQARLCQRSCLSWGQRQGRETPRCHSRLWNSSREEKLTT